MTDTLTLSSLGISAELKEGWTLKRNEGPSSDQYAYVIEHDGVPRVEFSVEKQGMLKREIAGRTVSTRIKAWLVTIEFTDLANAEILMHAHDMQCPWKQVES